MNRNYIYSSVAAKVQRQTNAVQVSMRQNKYKKYLCKWFIQFILLFDTTCLQFDWMQNKTAALFFPV